MSVRFRLLTEADVKAVLTMDDLIETMTSALQRFSSGRVTQPVRTVLPIAEDAFAGFMPAFVRGGAVEPGVTRRPSARGRDDRQTAEALGAKLVTVFGGNHARGLDSHLASIVLMNPDTGALVALLDGRYITEARTAAVSAVSSKLLARPAPASLAIIGSGVQARSHLEALTRVHDFRHVTVWSPQQAHRDRFVEWARPATAEWTRARAGHSPGARHAPSVAAVDHAGEAVVGADVIVLVTSSPSPVLEDGWVKPGAHVIAVGACRPNQREMDPSLVARARLFVDSRAAALVEAGDIVLGMQEGRFGADHIVAELGEVANGAPGRRNAAEVTVFKSLGLAVEDVTAADLAYRRAIDCGVGQDLSL
jgi:ornithine cyclodeaminase/alanine dehydrogenase-like protein (mu-crystallin family)